MLYDFEVTMSTLDRCRGIQQYVGTRSVLIGITDTSDGLQRLKRPPGHLYVLAEREVGYDIVGEDRSADSDGITDLHGGTQSHVASGRDEPYEVGGFNRREMPLLNQSDPAVAIARHEEEVTELVDDTR